MSLLIHWAVILAILGSALIGGIFFAFSSFIMGALARLPAAGGIAAMQAINVVVINATFLGVFFGTALLCLIIGIMAGINWTPASSPYLITGALLYVVGTFLVTVVGNVPLNNQLATVTAANTNALEIWNNYLEKWTLLNSLRSAAGILAALSLLLGLI